MVDVRVPARLTSRQRELLEELSVELGEVEPETSADESSTGAPSSQGRPRTRRGRRKRGLGDRLRDAIS
jgi:hypothetical protein